MKYRPHTLHPHSQHEALPVSRPIPPEMLIDMGRAAYGEDWQAPFAAALGIEERTLRQWAKDGAPPWASGPIRTHLNWRSEEIETALKFFEPPPE